MNTEREFLNSKVEFGGDMDMTFDTLTDQYIESQKKSSKKNNGNIFKKKKVFY